MTFRHKEGGSNYNMFCFLVYYPKYLFRGYFVRVFCTYDYYPNNDNNEKTCDFNTYRSYSCDNLVNVFHFPFFFCQNGTGNRIYFYFISVQRQINRDK